MLLGKLFQQESKRNCKTTIEATFPFKPVETKWNTLQINTSQIFFPSIPIVPCIVPITFFPKADPFWNVLKS